MPNWCATAVYSQLLYTLDCRSSWGCLPISALKGKELSRENSMEIFGC